MARFTSFDDLSDFFSRINLSDVRCVVIHSDLLALGTYLPRKNNILEDLVTLLEDQIIFIPAFTIKSFTSNNIFDMNESQPETGALSRLAHRSNWIRTTNPMHSYFASKFDPLFEDYFRYPTCHYNTSSFGKESILDKLSVLASVLQLGCFHNTFVHQAEAIVSVPYRFNKDFFGTARFESSNYQVSNTMYVRNVDYSGIEESDRVSKFFDFAQTDLCLEYQTPKTLCRFFKATDYLSYTIDRIQRNPFYLTSLT